MFPEYPIDLSKIEIDAYYQCYNNPEQTDKVLTRFRKFYPNSKIVLIRDGGSSDFKDIANKHQCIFKPSEYNMGLGNLNLNSALHFIARLDFAKSYFKSPVFMIQEDDVYLKNKLNGTLKAHFAGPCFGNVIEQKASDLLKQINVKYTPSYPFGGSGGTICKSVTLPTFKTFYNRISLLASSYQHVKQLECVDYLFSYILFLQGYDYEKLDELSEQCRDPNCIHDSRYTVIHGLKDWSGLEL